MARRGRRTRGGPNGLSLFALALTAVCLLLTWLVLPARAPDASNSRHAEASTRAAAARFDASPPRRTLPTVDGREALRVHFYDVSQGLAALVDLPDGRHILVDTGDAPVREGCGIDCGIAHRHLLAALTRDLAGAPIDVLWITHQHSDHIGGARDVLAQFRVKEYVDNGRDGGKAEVSKTHDAARARGTLVDVVDPSRPWSEAQASAVAGDARVTPVVPAAWPADCASDPNECSLALRIDLGASSVLFTGDAERGEERSLALPSSVTLLQVGHHGSETSTSEAFLARVAPRYAVISAGHPDVGMNHEYCLPRTSTLEKLSRTLGASGDKTLLGFDGVTSCRRSHGAGWVAVPVSDHLWATERDGDVVLVTHGDGIFVREGT
jgi:competence protein ComEC